MSISTSALLLDISFIVGGVITKNMLVALNQVVSPVNAATPSTLEIVGTLFLAGMMILALIYLVWLNISKARELVKERGHLDTITICHIHRALCSFFLGLMTFISWLLTYYDAIGTSSDFLTR